MTLLNITSDKSSCTRCDWSYTNKILMQKYAEMEIYTDECTDDEVCRLFVLIGKAVTWGMLAIRNVKILTIEKVIN